METVDGIITSYNERGELTVTAVYTNTEKFVRCGYKTRALY